jgi:hypothetical protein
MRSVAVSLIVFAMGWHSADGLHCLNELCGSLLGIIYICTSLLLIQSTVECPSCSWSSSRSTNSALGLGRLFSCQRILRYDNIFDVCVSHPLSIS